MTSAVLIPPTPIGWSPTFTATGRRLVRGSSCPTCWGAGKTYEAIEQATLDGYRPDDVPAVVAWVPVLCEDCRGKGWV